MLLHILQAHKTRKLPVCKDFDSFIFQWLSCPEPDPECWEVFNKGLKNEQIIFLNSASKDYICVCFTFVYL